MNNRRVVSAVLITILGLGIAWGQAAKKEGKGAATGGAGAKERILALEDEGREAALKGDASYLEKYLATDYIGIGGLGNVTTRDKTIQARKSGDVKYQSIEPSNRKVRVYGNTAIFTADAAVKVTDHGKPIQGNFRASRVWVKQGGEWKIAHFQATRVAENQ